MIAQLAEHALTNARLKRYLKARSTRSTLISAQIAVHAPMSALLRLFIRHRFAIRNKKWLYFPCTAIFYSLTFLNLNELVMTETELKLIARAAIIGERRIPKKGYKTPAAIGIPSTL